MNGLDKIIAKIAEQSKAECDEIIKAAETEADEITAEYAAAATEAEGAVAARLEREAEAVITRAKSTSSMTRRNVLSDAKSRAVDAAYERALEKVRSLPREEYAKLVTLLALTAIKSRNATAERRRELYGETQATADTELVFSLRDRDDIGEYVVYALKNTYKKELGADTVKRITLAADTADIDGGIIIRTGNVEENCAFSLMIDDMRENLDPVIYKTLYPETETERA